ncbi:MAG: PhnD/SsuA/transferrin family substrate-binding protein, partial [Thermoanaerobaculum sp.]
MATEGVGDGRLANREKLVLSACPHDTAEDPEQWFLFTQMLSKVLGHSIRFELALDFPDFWSTMEQLDLVYANPNDSLTLVSIHGFLPLARFNGRFDEGVVVGREDSPFDLQEISSKRVSTCTSMLVTNTVVKHLKKMGLQLGQIMDAPSWDAVLANLLKGEADFAILCRDFFEELRSSR